MNSYIRQYKRFLIKFFSNKYYIWIEWLQYNKQMNFVCEHCYTEQHNVNLIIKSILQILINK